MLSQLMRPEFIKGQKYQEQQWRAVRDGADPKILAFEKAFVKKMASLNVPFFATWVVRSATEQQKMFDAEVSRDSPEDGQWPHRKHAVDLIHGTLGYNLTKTQWALVGHVGKEVAQARGIKITWGGDWKFYDPAHWELTHWRML